MENIECPGKILSVNIIDMFPKQSSSYNYPSKYSGVFECIIARRL